MLSLLRNMGGSSSVLDKALATDERLVIPPGLVGSGNQSFSVSTNTPITPSFNRAFRIKKEDLDASLGKVMAAFVITTPPTNWFLRVMSGGAVRRSFPITYMASGNVPNAVPTMVVTETTSSTLRSTAEDVKVEFGVVRFTNSSAANGTAIQTSAAATLNLRRNQFTSGTSDTGQDYVNIIKTAAGAEPMSIYNASTTVSFYHVPTGKETTAIPIMRLGNPFSPGQYRPVNQPTVSTSQTGLTGNFPGGVINTVYALKYFGTYYINTADIKTDTIGTGGALAIQRGNTSTGNFLKNTGNENRVYAERVALYKQGSHTNWVELTDSIVNIANPFSEGSVVVNTGAASVTSAQSIQAQVTLSLNDDYVGKANEFRIRVRNDGTGFDATNVFGGSNSTYDVARQGSGNSSFVTYQINWKGGLSGSLPAAPATDQFGVIGQPLRVTLSVSNYPSVVLNRFYARIQGGFSVPGSSGGQKQTWLNNNGGGLSITSGDGGIWSRLYSGENLSYAWTGGGLTTENPRTTNNTPVVPATPEGTIDWDGSGTTFTVNAGDSLALSSTTPLTVTLPIEFI